MYYLIPKHTKLRIGEDASLVGVATAYEPYRDSFFLLQGKTMRRKKRSIYVEQAPALTFAETMDEENRARGCVNAKRTYEWWQKSGKIAKQKLGLISVRFFERRISPEIFQIATGFFFSNLCVVACDFGSCFVARLEVEKCKIDDRSDSCDLKTHDGKLRTYSRDFGVKKSQN